ncbi:MAG: hypothetical protein Q7T72_03720 [Bacteroidales bacterium]|nr:hypothetical protein [Bacteroidales bacterium]
MKKTLRMKTMFPMHKQARERLRDILQPFVSKVPMFLPEPTILIPDPTSNTEIEHTKHSSHLRMVEE